VFGQQANQFRNAHVTFKLEGDTRQDGLLEEFVLGWMEH
jgi:type IV secretory pathway VirD2 relaxase